MLGNMESSTGSKEYKQIVHVITSMTYKVIAKTMST